MAEGSTVRRFGLCETRGGLNVRRFGLHETGGGQNVRRWGGRELAEGSTSVVEGCATRFPGSTSVVLGSATLAEAPTSIVLALASSLPGGKAFIFKQGRLRAPVSPSAGAGLPPPPAYRLQPHETAALKRRESFHRHPFYLG